MELLKVLDRTLGCPHEGRMVTRAAVRAIVRDGRRLLMVYSPVNGDYKFPGGGVAEGESHVEALVREVSEECGARLSAVLGEFGKMVEYDLAVEPEMDIFRMTSYYYFATVDGAGGEQRLDDYEEALGFRPEWVDIDAAIANNRILAADPAAAKIKWLNRDLFVLEQLRARWD